MAQLLNPASAQANGIEKKKGKGRKFSPAKMGNGQKALFTVMFVLFIIYALTLLFPVLWMFLSSLKGSLEYQIPGTAFDLPKSWLFSNFGAAFSEIGFGGTSFFGMTWNSIWMTLLSIIVGTFSSAIVSYVMAKLAFPGRKTVYSVIILMMMIPISGTMAAAYKLRRDLGLYDNIFSVIVPAIGPIGGFKFLILYAIFKSISWEYAEAGLMDGASHMKIFLKIMFPQALPAILTFAMTDFIGGWNDYITPIMYMPSYPTLASGLYEYEAQMVRLVNYPVYFAGVILSVIPVLVLFIAFRDMFMSSLSMGGLKG